MTLGVHRCENFLKYLNSETKALQESGLYKAEYGITSPQQVEIIIEKRTILTNF